MILMAVAQHDGVDRSDTIDVGQQSRRRPLAEIQHQPTAAGLDDKAGRTFGAGARNQP